MTLLPDLNRIEVSNALLAIPPFNGFKQEELTTLVDMLETFVLKKNTVLYKPEKPASSLYILLSGKITISEEKTGEKPFAVCTPPSLISPLSFLFPTNALAYAVAEKECIICELTAGSFKMLQLSTPALALNIITGL